MAARPAHAVTRTPRLLLCRPRDADTAALAELLTDPEVMRHLGDGRPLDAEAVERWIRAAATAAPLGGIGILVVVLVESGRTIGWCGVELGEDTGRPEVTYAIHPDVQRRGLAGEALGAVLELADASTHADLAGVPLEATVDPANTASRRLLARHGFVVVAEAPDVHGIPTLFCRRPWTGRSGDSPALR